MDENMILGSILADKNGNRVEVADEKARAAIEEMKSSGTQVKAWLRGTTETVTPAQVIEALNNDRYAAVEVETTDFGKILFTGFMSVMDGAMIIASKSATMYMEAQDRDMTAFTALAGAVDTGVWTYYITPLATFNDILMIAQDLERHEGAIDELRKGVTGLQTDVDALNEEIEKLQDPGGTTITRSGKFVTLECDEGNEISIDGETTETVKLVHSGKNLLPSLTSTVAHESGVTLTPNADGSFTLNGTAAFDSWPDIISREAAFFLPAGTYTLSATGADDRTPFAIQATDNSFSVSVGNTYSQKTFTTEKDETMFAYITVLQGDSYSNRVINAQLEVGTGASSYVTHKKEVVNGTLPATFAAYEGINNFYTESGDMLRVTSRKSASMIIAEAVKQQRAVDWSAYGIPMLYLNGDTTGMTKDDAVNLSYVYGDRSGTASVKWQGSSSLNYPKKNYTIKFDNAFEAKEGWGAQKKYCFKANFIDHSHARNLMCASIWGDLVKTAVSSDDRRYSIPNGGAVDGFPCIIMLNDEFHGLYTWNIPKDGWMLGMGSGTQECILCANGTTQPNADGFKTLETTLGEAFDVEYITDENNTDWALTSLNRMLNAVINSDGSDLDTTVAQYLDWDSVIDHYIQTVLTAAHDCTYKNYLLSTYDGVKWFFTGYDMDSTFGLQWDGKSFVTADTTYPNFASYASVHRAMELIKTHKKDALKARYSALRAGALSEASITNKLTNYTAGIPSQVLDEDARKWPTIPSTSASNLAQMLNWYRLRVAVADAEINAL